MSSIKSIENFYFVGIGGIGMSALARYFNLQGKKVFGYDKTPSEITNTLIHEGIIIQFKDEVSLIPKLIQKNKNVLTNFSLCSKYSKFKIMCHLSPATCLAYILS